MGKQINYYLIYAVGLIATFFLGNEPIKDTKIKMKSCLGIKIQDSENSYDSSIKYL